MQRTSSFLTAVALALGAFLLTPSVSLAGPQGRSGVNTGATSFFDGFGRPVEGFTYQNYVTYTRSEKFMNAQGNKNPAFRDPLFETYVMLNQLSYTTPYTLFGGRARPGFNFILPLVGFRTHFGEGGPNPLHNRTGLADFQLGPVLQFLPVVVNGRPVFSQRFEFTVITPTGKYDPDKNFNQGTNFVSLNPYWAATVLPLPGFEVSWRLNYIYNFTNERPVGPPVRQPGGPFDVESSKGGQAIWLNFATSYEVVKTLHVGANGYYYQQITDDEYHLRRAATINGMQVSANGALAGTTIDGKAQGEGRQRVLGIGPGVFWETTKTDKLFANMYFQTLAKARPEGFALQARWIHSF